MTYLSDARQSAADGVPPARAVDLTSCLAGPERRPGRLLQRPSNALEVMIAVPHRVVLEHELARERSVGVERQLGRAVELVVGQRPDRRRGRGAVPLEQIQGRLL